jgi:CHAT domain-containing protein
LYGPGRSRIHTGDAACETTLKREAPRYDVLHIASHGLPYEQAPMFSALVLSPSAGPGVDDGLLEAREIAELDLGADLAVLSACETGKAGGGVIGLSWAFLVAGCPTTIVSQWKAHSAATATMMVEFHRQLVAGASKPEALRRAQLALRADPRYRHPFYWAPFIVVGSP